MKKSIYRGIKTNNLKNIDFEILLDSINCVIGPSGSGKSTLIFDTIYKISENNFQRLLGNEIIDNNFEIENYENILISIPLRQVNNNKNPRSTIATYYNIDKYFAFLFSFHNNIAPSIFSFNKYDSACKNCRGLGYSYSIDKSKIIDYEGVVSDIPFFNWKKGMSDYYKKLLEEVCKDNEIPIDKRFFDLSDKDKEFLLYGKSKKKYKIDFVQGKRKRVKTSIFKGVLVQAKEELGKNDNSIKNYTKKEKCIICNGGRFSTSINKYKFFDRSISEIYLLEISELNKLLNDILKSNSFTNNLIINGIKKIINFLNCMCKLNLGYLNLNRAITSLSGGEFQRLRIAQIINSDFDNLLYILDEPLASLHPMEKKSIINEILELRKKNTLLVVEHSLNFLKYCDKVTALGEGGGRKGGEIISVADYLRSLDLDYKTYFFKSNNSVKINTSETLNNVKPLNISLKLNTCIGIGGYSGSGKTTFIKNILVENLENYIYVSQKSISGNNYSIVASYIDIFDDIRKIFADINNQEISLFSFHYNSKGACETCKGKGKIDIEIKYEEKLDYICPDCLGKRYKSESLSYLFEGYNIYEILSMNIDEALYFFSDKNNRVYKKLEVVKKIGLDYLTLNQSISSLSGGESQRIKLLRSIRNSKSNKIYGLDEPFQGLNKKEIYMIMLLIYELIKMGNTFIIVEHNTFALNLTSYIIEFGLGSGKKGGEIIYYGEKKDIKNCSKSVLKKYLNIIEPNK